jgi:hypothetical protein
MQINDNAGSSASGLLFWTSEISIQAARAMLSPIGEKSFAFFEEFIQREIGKV